MGKLQVFRTPLLDKSAGHRAHDTEEEAEKKHDIDAKGGTWGIGSLEGLVYFDDK